MKEQVREGCFETNSSSTHAICIYRDIDVNGFIGLYNDMEYKLPYKEHKLYFDRKGEFGWENKHYHDTQTKANYLWQCIVACNLVDKLKNRIISVLKKYNIVAQFAPTEKYERTYNGQVVKYDKFVNDPECNEYNGGGYVDHGDEAADMVTAICFSDRLLMNYLFNDESFVATGNDNDGNLSIEDPNSYKNWRLAIFFKGN